MNPITILALISSASASIAIDSAAKILTPPAISTLSGFAIKGGTIIVGGLVSTRIMKFVSSKTKEIVDIVNSEVIEPSQDNN